MKYLLMISVIMAFFGGSLFFALTENPIKGEYHTSTLPEKFIKSSYYQDYELSNKFVIYVDFDRSRKKRRLWVTDKGKVIATSYTSHGVGSSSYSNFVAPTKFSNKSGSNQSSLGIFRIRSEQKMNPNTKHYCVCESYAEKGNCKHLGKKFPLMGLEKSNNNALARGIIIHTSSYVSEKGCTGNSEGCFVVSPEIFEILQQKNFLSLKNCYLLALK